MAFNKANFYNVYAGPPGQGMYIYSYGSETVETLLTAGYINNVDDFQNIVVGDLVFCTGDLGTFALRVSAVSAGGDISLTAEKSGNITAQTIWKQLTVEVIATGQGVNAPTLKPFRGNIDQLAFDGVPPGVEEVFFAFHLPHDIKPNVGHGMHIHWSHITASPTGDVKWFIDYTVVRSGNSEVFPAPTTISSVQTAGVQYEHQLAFSGLSIAASAQLEPDALFLARIYRDPDDGEDTFENDAFALNVDLLYQAASQGTIEQFRPYTSTGFS